MATSPSSATRSVLDASVAVRAFVNLDELALAWMRTAVIWPTLIYAEFGNAVVGMHRNGRLTLDDARRSLRVLHRKRAELRAVESLTRPAWDVALARNLSVYDACYVVLAEGLGVPLVTADRRLAGATPNAVLLA